MSSPRSSQPSWEPGVDWQSVEGAALPAQQPMQPLAAVWHAEAQAQGQVWVFVPSEGSALSTAPIDGMCFLSVTGVITSGAPCDWIGDGSADRPAQQGFGTWDITYGALPSQGWGSYDSSHDFEAYAAETANNEDMDDHRQGSMTPTTCESAGMEELRPETLGSGDMQLQESEAPRSRAGRTAFLRRQRQRRAKARVAAQQAAEATSGPKDELSTLASDLEAGGEGRHAAVAALRGSVRQLAFEVQGCRVVQSALQHASRGDLMDLVSELHGHVREAIESPHANYVIQKAVEALPTSLSGFVAVELLGAGAEMARHKFGCRVVCRLLEHSALTPATEALAGEILAEAGKLSRHTFGHHVVQSVLEHGRPGQRREVVEALRGDLLRNSRNRNSSYVVEKALTHCDPEERAAMASELLSSPDEVLQLAQCQFGSYVVKALARLPDEFADTTIAFLLQEAPRIAASKYGKRLLEDLGFEDGAAA